MMESGKRLAEDILWQIANDENGYISESNIDVQVFLTAEQVEYIKSFKGADRGRR